MDHYSPFGWPIGHRINGRYEVTGIRHGGLATVYLSFDHEFQQDFAIKIFQDRYLQDAQVVARFLQEAELWMRLEKHKNIVWARWVEKINSRPYIFMEYIAGDSKHGADLSGWIGTKELTMELTLQFAVQTCTGMIYARRKFNTMKRPFVHRDLKPTNIMIAPDGVAKVTDFGIAKVCALISADIKSDQDSDESNERRLSFTKVGTICGTPLICHRNSGRGGKGSILDPISTHLAVCYMRCFQAVLRLKGTVGWSTKPSI